VVGGGAGARAGAVRRWAVDGAERGAGEGGSRRLGAAVAAH